MKARTKITPITPRLQLRCKPVRVNQILQKVCHISKWKRAIYLIYFVENNTMFDATLTKAFVELDPVLNLNPRVDKSALFRREKYICSLIVQITQKGVDIVWPF